MAVLIAAGALLLVASYPPFALAPLTPALSFIAVTPAVLLLHDAGTDQRSAFRFGFWYGLAANALVLYWMIVALWRFTKLSGLAYLATIGALALFTGTLFWFVSRLRARLPALPLWITFPIAWTALEWGVGHLSDIRFPWLGLGTSLADAPVLAQWADIAGARGLTLWLAWSGAMVAEAVRTADGGWRMALSGWRTALRNRRVLRPLGAVVATIVVAAGYGYWRMHTIPLRDVGTIGLVQPNVPYDAKWQRARADDIVAELLSLTERVLAVARPALVIWPEAAIPGYVQVEPDWRDAIRHTAQVSHTPILAGGLFAEFDSARARAGGQRGSRSYTPYNAAFLFDSTGDWQSQPWYGKHYLVPIVERVPFVPARWFKGMTFFGGFGRGHGFPVYHVGIGRFGVAVCYESAFEELARRYRRTGADFLVNITNDAWYGLTSAPYQHESHLVLRAIETRMGIARAANSGISEFLDPLGRASLSTKLETQTIVAGTLRTSDVIPLYVRLGDWVGIGVVLITLGWIGFLFAQRKTV
jgi:apolipoprotein N-acyltransferase